MATLVKTTYGAYVGPGSKFRVVVQLFAEDTGTGQKLTLRKFVQVVAGTNGFGGTICTITWGAGSVQLYKDGYYATLDTDLGTYEYGKSYSLNDIKAYYTGSSTYTSSTSINYTVPTKTYTISYNMNGGFGTIADQTKTHGKDLELSNVIPIFEGRKFAGWSTILDGEPKYQPGDIYSEDAAITLYAVWKEEGAAFLNQDKEILKGKMILNDDGDQVTGIPIMKINGKWQKGGA